jgi:hypothetical protein
MIVSYRHDFIMHSISKVASTTLLYTIKESGILGEQDVISRFSIDAFHSQDPKVYPSKNIPSISWDKFTNEVIEKPIHGIPFKGKTYCRHPIFESMSKDLDESTYRSTIIDLYAKAFTLKELVNSGIVEDPERFKVYGFIRDPIERYISLFFMWSRTGHVSGNDLDNIIEQIDSIDEEYGHPFFLNRKYSDYFTYDGVTHRPLIYEDRYKDRLKEIINHYGGQVNELSRLKSDYRPNWSREDYNKWLPKSSVDKLNRVFQEDIEFYNTWRN